MSIPTVTNHHHRWQSKVGKNACRLILTQREVCRKIPSWSPQRRLPPLILSKRPLKQLTDSAETTSSGKEFHIFTILHPSSLALKRPLQSLFQLYTVSSSSWSHCFVARQDLSAVDIVNSMHRPIFEDFHYVST